MKKEIPEYTINVLNSKKNKYAVIVCVFNEGERFTRQLSKMIPNAKDLFDIVLADGPSTDGTTEPSKMKKAGVQAIVLPQRKGLSIALRAAFDYCMEQGYEGIVFLDGHDKDDTSALKRFAEYMDKGYDYIQGSRFIKGGKAIRTPLSRYLLVRFVHAPFFTIICRKKLTDTTNGFRALSRKLVLDEKVRLFRNIFEKYELPNYITWAACHYGFKVTEIPVTRAYPEDAVPTKLHGISGYWYTLKPLLMLLFRRY